MSYLDEIEDYLKARINSSDFLDYMGEALLEICKIDSTPSNSITDLASRENDVFEILIRLIKETGFPGEIIKYPIDNNLIKVMDSYTPLHYTDADEPYEDRYNLVFHYHLDKENKNGESLAFNAHIDTVHPHIAPKQDGTRVSGRGSADDKGNIISMIGILKLLGEIKDKFGIATTKPVYALGIVTDYEKAASRSST